MLKAGDKAPAFDLETDEGGRVALRDFDDGKVVLYFYPRDNTPGCTRQAQGFTAAKVAFEAAGVPVLGVSRDTLKSHASFRTKCGIGIPLLSDPDLSVHKAYGAWGEKTMYGKKVLGVLRSTFVIDHGTIARVFPSVKVDGHTDAVLRALGPSESGTPPNPKAESMKNKKAPGSTKTKSTSKGKKESEHSLGEVAGALVARAVSRVAAAIAPTKPSKKTSKKTSKKGAAKAVKKTAEKALAAAKKVVSKGGAKKKGSSKKPGATKSGAKKSGAKKSGAKSKTKKKSGGSGAK